MDRQTLRDWVHRFNAAGPDGLVDRKAPGSATAAGPRAAAGAGASPGSSPGSRMGRARTRLPTHALSKPCSPSSVGDGPLGMIPFSCRPLLQAHSEARTAPTAASGITQTTRRANVSGTGIMPRSSTGTQPTSPTPSRMRAEGRAVPDALLVHTSPLIWGHIGFSGDLLWDCAVATSGRRRPHVLDRGERAQSQPSSEAPTQIGRSMRLQRSRRHNRCQQNIAHPHRSHGARRRWR